jgi:hypothetical protein
MRIRVKNVLIGVSLRHNKLFATESQLAMIDSRNRPVIGATERIQTVEVKNSLRSTGNRAVVLISCEFPLDA